MSEQPAPRRGGRRPGAGRPPDHGERKRQHTLTLSADAWHYLDAMCRSLGLDHRSQAVERLVRAAPGYAATIARRDR